MPDIPVYIVEEWNVDYDDYPIGMKTHILATFNKERAIAVSEQEPRWPATGRRVRGWRELKVENLPDPIVLEYADAIERAGFRLGQAFVCADNKLERTLYAKGDDGKDYVIVANV